MTDMKALSILLHDGPQTAGSLMARLAVTSGAVTGVINRLADHRLARRQADPQDGRKVVVTVDLAGLAARENVYLSIGAAFDRLHATYSTQELRFLTRHLETAIEITRQETAALNRTRDSPAHDLRRRP
ncbi:MarR family winged helix-turn-helix transcriptional regulator [Frankia sp. ACN1ag]|uniref:MarR family winged helix-turn-helix transcriptional regulator n=1 Tax=Frankia sp. ACN1ag TaxID=102891 RepID=UPI0037BE4E9E